MKISWWVANGASQVQNTAQDLNDYGILPAQHQASRLVERAV
jgi:hypothetical protein